jgi:hypothetical protein
MPIKVLIMVIEGDALPQHLPKPQKGIAYGDPLPALWLACFTSLPILGCKPWYLNSRFLPVVLGLVLGCIQIVYNAC